MGIFPMTTGARRAILRRLGELNNRSSRLITINEVCILFWKFYQIFAYHLLQSIFFVGFIFKVLVFDFGIGNDLEKRVIIRLLFCSRRNEMRNVNLIRKDNLFVYMYKEQRCSND